MHINDAFLQKIKEFVTCLSEISSCLEETLRHSIASDKFVKSKPYRYSFVYMINFNGVISLNLPEL